MLISLSISIRFAVKRRDGCKSSRVACIITHADLPVQTVNASTQSFTHLAVHSPALKRLGNRRRVQNEPGSTGTFQILVGKHDQKFQPFREPKRATRKATKVFSETDPLLCPSAAARWPRAHETPERVSSGVFPAAASFAASCVRPCASGCHRRHAGRHENVRARDLPVASELLPPFISARSAAAGASARLSPSSPLESPSRSHISVTRHCRRCQAHFLFFLKRGKGKPKLAQR
jgi:hypothetical protein